VDLRRTLAESAASPLPRAGALLPAAQELIEQALRSEGYCVLVTNDANEALELSSASASISWSVTARSAVRLRLPHLLAL